MQLYDYQQNALDMTKDKDNCAFYYDMGLGKTFIGSERMRMYDKAVNIVICQKSKIRDWYEHFETNYKNYIVCDLTKKREIESFISQAKILIQSRFMKRNLRIVGIINYELAYKRTELLNLIDFTLMLDESSMIKNEVAKRTKFILKLAPAHVILLSGTPTDGKYEYLYSQLRLLGWKITKTKYYEKYIETKLMSYGGPIFRVVTGYKNVDDLKDKLKEYGALFAKTNEVIMLPEKTFIPEYCEASKEYKRFMKDRVITVEGKELVGDTSLTKRLYARMLCSAYNGNKLKRFADLIDSTSDRVIVFYNFNSELSALMNSLPKDRPRSVINGSVKDLVAYEDNDNSVTFVQYQAGAMGLNLQKANRIIYFSLPERSELFEQSKARICRIGQEKQCYYHIMMCRNSVEEKILDCLKMRKDYTDELFRKDFE